MRNSGVFVSLGAQRCCRKLVILFFTKNLYMISLPWKYVGKGITWIHFSVRNRLSLFILFSSKTTLGMSPQHLNTILFLDLNEVSIQQTQYLGMLSALPVLLGCFWKNVIPIHPLSTYRWTFFFSTNSVSQTNCFGLY